MSQCDLTFTKKLCFFCFCYLALLQTVYAADALPVSSESGFIAFGLIKQQQADDWLALSLDSELLQKLVQPSTSEMLSIEPTSSSIYHTDKATGCLAFSSHELTTGQGVPLTTVLPSSPSEQTSPAYGSTGILFTATLAPVTTPDGNDNNGQPPSQEGLNSALNTALDKCHCNQNSKHVAQGGGGGDDPDDGSMEEGQVDDPPDKEFDKFKDRVKKCRIYQVCKRIRLIKDIARFSSEHPDYSLKSYRLLTELIAYDSLALIIVTKMGLNLGLAFSSFDNFGIATAYAFLIMVGDVMAVIVPWVLPVGEISTLTTLAMGSTIVMFTDNGFSHLSNSSYAIEWDSPDLTNYGARNFLLGGLSLLFLEGVYSRLLVERLLAGILLKRHLMPLLAADVIAKPAASYLVEAVAITKLPFLALFCARNPLEQHHYPIPRYCPKHNWLPMAARLLWC